MSNGAGEPSAAPSGQAAVPGAVGIQEQEEESKEPEMEEGEWEARWEAEGEEEDCGDSDALAEKICDQFKLRKAHSILQGRPIFEAEADEEGLGHVPEEGSSDPEMMATEKVRSRNAHAAKGFAKIQKAVKLLKAGPADTRAPLPMKCGWLEKMSSGIISSSERMWVVLQGRVLRWFSSPQESKEQGHVDFEVLQCQVFKQWSAADEYKLGGLIQKRSRCSGCDLWASMMNSVYPSDAVIFHVGRQDGDEDAVLVLRAVDIADGVAWVEAIARHIDPDRCSDKDKAGDSLASHSLTNAPTRSLLRISTSNKCWWQVKTISPEKFKEIVRTGDILLFRTPGTVPSFIRSCSGGRFDHVALLLRLEGGWISLLEATGNQGVALCLWDDFVRNAWHLIYHELALRRVAFDRTGERLQELQHWAASVIGKPYKLTVGKLLQRKSVTQGGAPNDGAYFCSQLVAEALKVASVLPRGKSSTQYWPASFESSAGIATVEGCSFDDELTLVFPDRKSKDGKSRPEEGRDVTARFT